MATFQLSEDEFIAGSLALSWKRRTFIIFAIAFGLLVASLAFHGHTMVESIAYPFGGIVALLVFVYFLSRYRLKKIFRETASLQEVINVVIDDQQLDYSWARGSYVLPWSNVRRWKETRNFIILFESSFFGRLLPKRALSSDEIATIHRNVSSKPRR